MPGRKPHPLNIAAPDLPILQAVAAREDEVERAAGAGHVESWNAEPRRYRAELRAFVSRVLSAP